MWQLFPAPGI